DTSGSLKCSTRLPADGGVMPHSHRRTLALYEAYSAPKSEDNARSSGLIWNSVMYSTNTGKKSTASQLDKYTAHASTYSRTLRYMGLRVMRNMPPETSDDVALGLIGFMVVLARTNEPMPAIPKTDPTEAMTTATATRTPNDTSAGATNCEASHISTPKSI